MNPPPPLLQLGFRPFFLGGAVFAALAVPPWIAGWFGRLGEFTPAGGWLVWHQHEMLFGFGGAIVAGFLLTAVQNWTGVPGLSGRPLLMLAGLWLAARLAFLVGAPPAALMALALPFFPVVAAVMARSLVRARQARNAPIVLVLALLALAELVVLLGMERGDYGLVRQGTHGALWLVAALMSLIGGRVLPFFTARGLGQGAQVKAIAWLDWGLLAGGVLVALSMLAGIGLRASAWQAPLFGLLAVGHGARLARWYDRGVVRVPLLWSLYLAYGWFVVAFAAMAAFHLGIGVGFSQATHLLAIGGMSGLILAMIARVTLGHTGRPLSPPPAMSVAFALLNLAVPVRVWGIGAWPEPGYWAAAILWTIAFGLFVVQYAPMLIRPRVDGRPG